MMFEPIVIWLEWKLKVFLIWLMKGISLGLWYVEKACAWLTDQIMTNTVWETISDSLVGSMSASMPASLRSVLFGTGGGLFYIALMLISLTMIMPYFFKQGQQVIQLERLLGWSMLVIALFISSTAGYDALGLIETTRQDTIAGIVSGWGTGNTSDFVARPMSATAAEINVTDFELPAAFEATYYPDPSGYNTETIVFYDAPLIGANTSTFLVETDASIDLRISQGSLGLVLAILNLIPMAMVIILGLTFAMLTASALILIIFFVVALPLGIFEAGGNLLAQIATRYLTIWLLSIFIAIFPSMLLGVTELILTPPVTLTGLFTYIAVLIVAVIATHHLAKWVYQISVEGFATIGQSINATLQPYAYGGNYRQPLPTPDYLPPAYARGAMVGAAEASVAPFWIGAAAGAVGPAAASAAAGTVAGGATFGAKWLGDRMGAPGKTKNTETAIVPTHHVFQYMDEDLETVVDGEFEEIIEPKGHLPEPSFIPMAGKQAETPSPTIILGDGEKDLFALTPKVQTAMLPSSNQRNQQRAVNHTSSSMAGMALPYTEMPFDGNDGYMDSLPYEAFEPLEMPEFPPDLPEDFGGENA